MSRIPTLPVRDERVRRIAVAAAKGGGGLLGVGTALAGAFIGAGVVQAHRAKRAIGPRRAVPPYADGRYLPLGWTAARGTSLRLAVIGDSGAAGLGANDVTHVVRPQVSARLLAEAVRRLREAGTEVVVGTCPDLGTVKPLGPPLRQYARRMSRELAAAQDICVREAGGRPVPLGILLGPAFDADPELYFSDDRFHPSTAGYVACARALLPEVLAAAGLVEQTPALPAGTVGTSDTVG